MPNEKSYYVIRRYKSESILPSIVFSTANRDDAIAYAGIMHRSDGNEYSVVCDLN